MYRDKTKDKLPLKCFACMILPGSMNQASLFQIPMVCLLQQDVTGVKTAICASTYGLPDLGSRMMVGRGALQIKVFMKFYPFQYVFYRP
jgi:hypothetical protein